MKKFAKLIAAVSLLTLSASPLYAQSVNCNHPGEDLQKEINSAKPGAELHVVGTCEGNFFINKDLKLRGPATLSAPSGGIVVHVQHHSVKFTNLTIDADGASSGILTTGAALQLNQVVIEGATDFGIRVDIGSNAQIFGTSVFRNNRVGISVSTASSLRLSNSIIEYNDDVGLSVEHSGAANTSNNTIHHNGTGINVNANASIFLADSTITNNASFGLVAATGGTCPRFWRPKHD